MKREELIALLRWCQEYGISAEEVADAILDHHAIVPRPELLDKGVPTKHPAMVG